MIAMDNTDEFLKIIAQTPYKTHFETANFGGIDEILPEYLYKFTRSILSSGDANINNIWAYMHLKSIEVSNLVKIIEGVRYNTSPDEIKKYLVGVG